MAIRSEPTNEAGMLYVAVILPPAPVFVLPTLVPPTPAVPNVPIKTSNASLAGKLSPFMVTVLSATTEVIEKVGNPVVPGGTVAGDGDGVGEGVGEADPEGVDNGGGVTDAVLLKNQLNAKNPEVGLCRRMEIRSIPVN